MLVRNRMIPDPITVRADDLLILARLKMQKGNFRRLPVLSDGKIVGVITIAISGSMWACSTALKSRWRCQNPISVTPGTTVETAAQLLLRHKIGGVSVVDNG